MATPDRWAPWQEGREKALQQDFTTATPTVVSGLTFTVTPHINTRVVLLFQPNTENVGAASDAFAGDLYVNGVLAQSGPGPIIPAGGRPSNFWLFYANLVKETTYLIELRCWLVGALTTMRIYATRSHATLQAMPNLHS